MKYRKILLFSLFCLIIEVVVYSQDYEVITDAELPQGLLLKDNTLYIGNASNPGGILTADIDGQLPTDSSLFLPYPIECNDMAINGNDLYLGEVPGGFIFKIDLSVGTENVEEIETGFNAVIGLSIKNDFLYFSTGSSGKICRLNVNNLSSPAEVIIEGFDFISGMEFFGDELFFCSGLGQNSGEIYKFDSTLSNPVPELIASGFEGPWGIAVSADKVYISDLYRDEIKVIDLSNGNSISTLLNVDNPRDIDFEGSYLYIAKSNEVVRINPDRLSIPENSIDENVRVYPVPSNNNLFIDQRLINQNYVVFDISGQSVMNGFLEDELFINIKTFSNGVYFIKFDNGVILKFIKN